MLVLWADIPSTLSSSCVLTVSSRTSISSWLSACMEDNYKRTQRSLLEFNGGWMDKTLKM